MKNNMRKISFKDIRMVFLLLLGEVRWGLLCLAFSININAQNPFLPLWEYIPDGEPYVFEDPDKPGEYRVYVYGSHDSLIKEYCGLEQVVWSASVNDLKHWRYDGVIFRSVTNPEGKLLNPGGKGDLLYAPDIAVRTEADGTKTYYLYPNVQNGGRQGMVAKAKRPDGPFEVCNWSKDNSFETDGVLRFDPAVFVDDDGRVYGYWGFDDGGSLCAELDPNTMATVKPGTEIVKDMIPNRNQPGIFRFFEASSMRKIDGKYVFIYSRFTEDGENGLPTSNYTLAYAYSDNPMGPFNYGGTIIDGRAIAKDKDGKSYATATPGGNTHGSIFEANGQWWVVYHRQTGLDEYSRQAMVAPITVKVEKKKGGKVTITEGEYTSEGFTTEGLNPLHRTAAGWACYYTSPEPAYNEWPKFFHTGSYVKATRIENPAEQQLSYNLKEPLCPVINNTAGSTVGYKYFNMSKLNKKQDYTLELNLKPEGVSGSIKIMIGAPTEADGGKAIGLINLDAKMPQKNMLVGTSIDGWQTYKGKQPLFFVFESATKGKSLCEINEFIIK